MKILFKYPTRDRKEWFVSTLSKYYEQISDNCNFEFVISLNKDDSAMNNKTIQSYMNSFKCLSYFYGDHANKILACNADIDLKKEWDILVLVSDDMIPVVKNFDEVITESMQKHFPDTDGALHFNDGHEGDKRNITFSIIGRKLYERIGYVYHPDYKSFFCDNEFTDVVRSMDKYSYSEQVIVEHRHWSCKDTPPKDSLYCRNSKMGKPDKQTYLKRKSLQFPNESVY